MKIWISTDANGHESVNLTDPAKYGPSGKGLHTANILIHAATGHVFAAPVGLRGLSRLSPADAEMVSHFLKERGAAEVDVFAGDPT